MEGCVINGFEIDLLVKTMFKEKNNNLEINFNSNAPRLRASAQNGKHFAFYSFTIAQDDRKTFGF